MSFCSYLFFGIKFITVITTIDDQQSFRYKWRKYDKFAKQSMKYSKFSWESNIFVIYLIVSSVFLFIMFLYYMYIFFQGIRWRTHSSRICTNNCNVFQDLNTNVKSLWIDKIYGLYTNPRQIGLFSCLF